MNHSLYCVIASLQPWPADGRPDATWQEAPLPNGLRRPLTTFPRSLNAARVWSSLPNGSQNTLAMVAHAAVSVGARIELVNCCCYCFPEAAAFHVLSRVAASGRYSASIVDCCDEKYQNVLQHAMSPDGIRQVGGAWGMLARRILLGMVDAALMLTNLDHPETPLRLLDETTRAALLIDDELAKGSSGLLCCALLHGELEVPS